MFQPGNLFFKYNLIYEQTGNPVQNTEIILMSPMGLALNQKLLESSSTSLKYD